MGPSIALTSVYRSAWIPNDFVEASLHSEVVEDVLRNGTVDVCPRRAVQSLSKSGSGAGRRIHCLHQHDFLTSPRIYDSFAVS